MASRIYPFSPYEAQSSRYHVTVDGTDAPLHCARVSAFPFNRCWPGHQRPVEQTELAFFVQYETDGPTVVTVQNVKAFAAVAVNPVSAGVTAERTDTGTVTFTLPGPGFYSVEFDGWHEALFLFADVPSAYTEEDRHGENVLYFGPGSYELGRLRLTSGQTVFIDEGAVVYGSLYAIDAHDIKILGRGILDGSHNYERLLRQAFNSEDKDMLQNGFEMKNAERDDTIQLEFCDRVTIDGITIRDSLQYNINPFGCLDLTIANVKLIGNWRYNTDGIDLHNCIHTRIHDCFLRTFDDSFCIKGISYTPNGNGIEHNGRVYDRFDDAVIEHCVIWNDWGKALEFGLQACGQEITNVVYRDIDIIRTAYGACTVTNGDCADMHDCLYDNIRVQFDAYYPDPMIQSAENQAYTPPQNGTYMPSLFGVSIIYSAAWSGKGRPQDRTRGKIHDITFRNIQVFADRMPSSYFIGYDETHRVENITVDGLYFNGRRITSAEEGNLTKTKFADPVSLK